MAKDIHGFLGIIGGTENAGVENAGVEIVTPEGRGGKRGKNEYGEPKFPFSNIVVESSIGLHSK